jgi:hypothetical protein
MSEQNSPIEILDMLEAAQSQDLAVQRLARDAVNSSKCQAESTSANNLAREAARHRETEALEACLAAPVGGVAGIICKAAAVHACLGNDYGRKPAVAGRALSVMVSDLLVQGTLCESRSLARVGQGTASDESCCPAERLARRYGALAKEYMNLSEDTDEADDRRAELREEMSALEAMSSFEQVSSAVGAMHQLLLTWRQVEELDDITHPDKLKRGDAARAAARRLLSSVIAYLEQVSCISSLEIGRKYSGL